MGAGVWKVILQLLKEQSEKMEKLGTALKCIQEGMLKDNSQPVKTSVGEATEVLGSLVNTHKHLIKSGVEFQTEPEFQPITRKMEYSGTAPSVSGGYPEIAQSGGEEGKHPLPPRNGKFKKGKGSTSPSYATVTRSQPLKEEGECTWCKIKKIRAKRFR